MKTCIFSYMFRYYPLKKAFEISQKCGFDGIEIWGGRPHAYPYDMDSEKIREIKHLSRDYHLEIPVYSPEVMNYQYNLCSFLPRERQETIDYLKRAIEISAELGARSMLCPFDHAGYGRDMREVRKILTDEICELGEYAEKYGVRLMLEAVTLKESNVVYRLEDILQLLDAAGSEYVTSMIDFAPIAQNEEPLEDYMLALGDKLDHVHFIDADRLGMHHYNIGEANLPMDMMLKVLKKHHYDRYICVELIWPYIKDPELYAYDTAIRLRKLFESIEQ